MVNNLYVQNAAAHNWITQNHTIMFSQVSKAVQSCVHGTHFHVARKLISNQISASKNIHSHPKSYVHMSWRVLDIMGMYFIQFKL